LYSRFRQEADVLSPSVLLGGREYHVILAPQS
jgi:hypothetical protein